MVIKLKNPFPYSLDNKRYQTWNYYLQKTFHHKVYKVPLNGGFTCPNRDGKVAVGGCTFCSSSGSGDFIAKEDDLLKQYELGRIMMEKKWPNGKAIAYFQSYTNTYGSLEKIKACIEPFLNRDDIVAVSIATRADCLEEDVLEYLQTCTRLKEIWIELGLQTIHDETAKHINRGHSYSDFLIGLNKLKKTDCKICVHLMNGLPNETKEMMIETAREVGKLPIHAVKIHMLHLIKGTKMETEYQLSPFAILSREEYVDIVVSQLEVFPKEIIIQRLTGDGMLESLVAPLWTIKKTIVLNEIDKEMVRRDTWQGKKAE